MKGKAAEDDASLRSLGVSGSCKFMMVGSVEAAILPERHEIPDLPDVIDDLEWDYLPQEGAVLENAAENERKLARRLETVLQPRGKNWLTFL